MTTPRHVTYADAGVDVGEAARAVNAIKASVATTTRPEVIGDLGGFGALFSASTLKRMDHPVLVSGTDGVGTKLAIAQMLNRHDTVGEDLVAMCVDDIVVVGAEPLFFLDYIAVGKLSAEAMATVVSGIAEGCRKAGCALIGGEMAEHPGVMSADDYDLAGFVVGVVEHSQMLGPARVCEGDIILGIPSSGLHSNGYSLVRKVAIENRSVAELCKPLPELNGQSIADAVMQPTSIYAGALIAALAEGAPIHAMAHITGGGITENLDRSLPPTLDALVEWGASDANSPQGFGDGPCWDVPPIIKYVVSEAGLTPAEAYRTFNMGVGMALVCAAQDAQSISQALLAQGLSSFTMGTVAAGTGQVRYR